MIELIWQNSKGNDKIVGFNDSYSFLFLDHLRWLKEACKKHAMSNCSLNSSKRKVDKILSDCLRVVTKLIKCTCKVSKFLATCLDSILDAIFIDHMYNITHSITMKSLRASWYIYFLSMIHSLKSFKTHDQLWEAL